MNNGQKRSWHKLYRITGGAVLMLFAGSVNAAEQVEPRKSSGIPGILEYAQKYRSETGATVEAEKAKETTGTIPSGEFRAGYAELRRRLLLREQELRQLKKENRVLREKLKAGSDLTAGNKEKLINSLKTELEESRKQQGILTLKAEQADKDKAELMSSLAALREEMAHMPVVTPEMLKPETAQQTYASGVMLGREMLNIQAAQQKLGLTTDNRILVAGIRDALNQKVQINESALETALRQSEDIAQKARQAVIQKQKKAGDTYLEKFKKQKGVKQAESGFWYNLIYAGDGEFIRGDNTLVDVVVTEKLTDGTVVEDMDARGRVISQTLDEYPPIFRAALMLMKNHGTMELVVPPELAYGDEGYPPKVPPGATMVYTLRVEEVKPSTAVPESTGLKGKSLSPDMQNNKAGVVEGKNG